MYQWRNYEILKSMTFSVMRWNPAVKKLEKNWSNYEKQENRICSSRSKEHRCCISKNVNYTKA